jgi:hypothetical protein
VAVIKLITGKEITTHGPDCGMTPIGLTYRPSSVVLPDGGYEMILIPWSRIDSFRDLVNPSLDGETPDEG